MYSIKILLNKFSQKRRLSKKLEKFFLMTNLYLPEIRTTSLSFVRKIDLIFSRITPRKTRTFPPEDISIITRKRLIMDGKIKEHFDLSSTIFSNK